MTAKIFFNRDQKYKLIKEVKQRPCLWNPYDEEYNKRNAVARAWEDISTKMDNVPAMFLRSKWKSLRDTFKKEYNKNPDSYNGPWRYFNRLSFLVFKTENEKEENDSDNEDVSDSNESNDMETVKRETDHQYEIPDKRRKPNEEEFDVLFLQSLTPYFKKLDPIRKLVVRSKMQDMLFNEISAQNSGNGPIYD